MQNEFHGKVVVVTGSSRGIGRSVALAFARAGAQTVIAGATEKTVGPTAAAIKGAGGPEPIAFAGDLRRLDRCEALFRLVEKERGRCDVLVHSAGATRSGNFLELADETWLDGFALKFMSAVRLSRLFWPMLKQARGHVVAIGGGAARTPDAGFLIGGSVNAAMSNFAKGLASLGKRDNVNVNVIHPGLTQTDRVADVFRARATAAGVTLEQVVEDTLAAQGISRIGQPEDVAELTLFLCSERARHVQGTAIALDGGATPGFY
jgi:NAD(P)-dependent dehydrogenase (short-subunit alcohol dehydrogenase family)